MYYIIDLELFVVLRGPFMNEQQAINAKTICCLKRAKELMAIVKVSDRDWN